jgi:hypothetical protein
MDEENKDGMVTPEEEMKKADEVDTADEETEAADEEAADEAASEPAADTDEAAA